MDATPFHIDGAFESPAREYDILDGFEPLDEYEYGSTVPLLRDHQYTNETGPRAQSVLLQRHLLHAEGTSSPARPRVESHPVAAVNRHSILRRDAMELLAATSPANVSEQSHSTQAFASNEDRRSNSDHIFAVDDDDAMSVPEWESIREVTLTYTTDSGTTAVIPAVDVQVLHQRCPLLLTACENSSAGRRLHLEAVTGATAAHFLRYLSTGSYAHFPTDDDEFESVPTSLLLHCRMYWLATIYDIDHMRLQANVNIIRQCEYGCSSPKKPIDLCDAIIYVYEHMIDCSDVIDTIISYCVECFSSHRLAQDERFRQLAYDLRPFHQHLCTASREQNFENETALAIIQLPFRPHIPDTYASREDIDGRNITNPRRQSQPSAHSESYIKKRKRRPRRDSMDKITTGPCDAESHASSSEPTDSDWESAGEAHVRPKRRASSVTSTKAMKSEPTSDAEYEIIPRSHSPRPVKSEPSSDDRSMHLPIRTRPEASTSARTQDDPQHILDDYDSDSEWSLCNELF